VRAVSVVVLFDLGDTLVIPRLAAGSLQGLDVLPFIPEILTRLKGMKVDGAPLRLGVISNTGDESKEKLLSMLTEAKLLGFFESDLLFFSSLEGMDKSQKKFFELAVTRAHAAPARCIYVGENDAERTVAASAGLRTSFHPLHVFHVIGLVSQGG
jgi:FMN phosphatase YigB (HAD superfamily)